MRLLESRELPHAQHFCEADWCRFRRATHAGPYIVSTVGELVRDGQTKMSTLGYQPDSYYETMVFRATKAKRGTDMYLCCGVTIQAGTLGSPLITERRSSAGAAQLMHEMAVHQAIREGFRKGLVYPW